jgi:hypothetical protein
MSCASPYRVERPETERDSENLYVSAGGWFGIPKNEKPTVGRNQSSCGRNAKPRKKFSLPVGSPERLLI